MRKVGWLLLTCLVLPGLVVIGWRGCNSDPQGEESAVCDKILLPQVRANAEWIVSAHQTVCSGFGGTSSIYVYVHKRATNPDRTNLVFRYSDLPYEAAPQIEWKSPNQLQISVNKVSQITKMVHQIGEIAISYQVATMEYPPARENN